MKNMSNALHYRWAFLLACCLVAGCTFDTAAELSTACVTDNDCTQGRVCSPAQVCQDPFDRMDASNGGSDTSDSKSDVAFGDVLEGDANVTPGDANVDPSDAAVDPSDVPVEPDVDPVEPNCDIILIDQTEVEACQDRIVFVSGSRGAAGNQGTFLSPLPTIGAGLVRAEQTAGKKWVLVEKGAYSENIELVNGIGIVGGYDSGWNRVANERSVVRGNSPTVFGKDILAPTILAYLEIRVGDVAPSDAGQAGKSVVTVMLQDSPGVVLQGLDVHGGLAGAGGSGLPGTSGSVGNDGGTIARLRPPGESVTCANGDKSGAGGEGGDNREDGEAGSKGENGGGNGGAEGKKGSSDSRNGTDGGSGASGRVGNPGNGALGGGEFEGMIWKGKVGSAGSYGRTGGGGGGGGGGRCQAACFAGGGGSGGCGGSGGSGGLPGGGSVALMLSNSNIKIVDSVLKGGVGGNGGDGGSGGSGGSGGKGKEFFGYGGNGGRGGAGGDGGTGGGGAGGPSFVIVSDQPFNLSVQVKDSEIVMGTGGRGGGGENTGAAGVAANKLEQLSGF